MRSSLLLDSYDSTTTGNQKPSPAKKHKSKIRLASQEIGMKKKKTYLGSGNEELIRGTFQHLSSHFSTSTLQLHGTKLSGCLIDLETVPLKNVEILC